VPKHQYVYQQGNRWVFAASLPARYHDFDLYHSYKVVENEPRPYMHHDADKVKYENQRSQRSGRYQDSHEEKYYVIKDHPEHNKWAKQHEHDHDHGKH